MKKFFLVMMIVLLTACGTKETKETDPEPNQEETEEVANYNTQVDDALANMTLEEKVGQIFLVRLNEKSVTNEIKTYQPSGYVLFAINFKGETPKTMRDKIASYQKISKIPLIMAVDEEGGTVNRVSYFPSFRSEKFKSNQELYKEGGYPLIKQNEIEKIDLLKALGINLNLAPVADVSTNPKDYIYDRSFGADATKTSEYIDKIVSLNVEYNMATCLKHFPGYGNNVDTHTGIAIDKRSYDNFVNSDFKPFEAGIKAGSPAILVAHNIVYAFDSTKPASLSLKVHQVLRDDLKYDGLIITDDLAMDAITKYIGKQSSAVLALQAGNDLIITSSFKQHYTDVLNAIKNGTISEERLNEAVRRVLTFKYQYQLITE